MLRNALVCENAHIMAGASVEAGAIISFGVVIGPGHSVPPNKRLSLCKQMQGVVSARIAWCQDFASRASRLHFVPPPKQKA